MGACLRLHPVTRAPTPLRAQQRGPDLAGERTNRRSAGQRHLAAGWPTESRLLQRPPNERTGRQ